MRALALLAFVALMGLAGVFILGGPGPVADGGGEVVADLRASVDGGEETGAATTPGNAQPDAKPTFYSYTDEQGRVHYVQNAASVPARYRGNAGAVDVKTRIIRPDEPSVPPGARPSSPPAFAFNPDTPEPRRQARAEVVVYTAPWCGWCRKTLAWLDERGVDYENKDIDANGAYRDELVRKTGNSSIPMVEVDGQRIRGFSPGKMRELLEI